MGWYGLSCSYCDETDVHRRSSLDSLKTRKQRVFLDHVNSTKNWGFLFLLEKCVSDVGWTKLAFITRGISSSSCRYVKKSPQNRPKLT